MVAAITLLLLAIGALFALGMFAVVWLLRVIGNLSEGKETEQGEERGESSRR